MRLATAWTKGRPRPRMLRPARRTELVTTHLDLVDRIAVTLRRRLPYQVEIEELRSAGYVGLVAATRAYSPARGVPLGAFARQRILGAMLDHLRSEDMLGRAAREKVRLGLMPFFVLQLHLDDDVFAHRTGLDRLSSSTAPADESAVAAQRREQIRGAMTRLTDRERHVITEYFWGDRQLEEIGGDLDIGESRASQIKNLALARLKRWLKH